jgi:DNA-directed RNA polymerase subunit A'
MIHNTRLPLADYGRVFPYDPKDAPEGDHLKSRGLLWNESFSEGLSPIAFFIHAIAGRQTIVEGATKTGGSGYSMRLGVKLMESCTTEYDGTVRDDGRIIQFLYNGTGLDPKPG